MESYLARLGEMVKQRAIERYETLEELARQPEIEERRALAKQQKIEERSFLERQHEIIRQHLLARQPEIEERRALAKQQKIEERSFLERQHEIIRQHLTERYETLQELERQHEIIRQHLLARQPEIEERRTLGRLHEIIKRRELARQPEIEERRAAILNADTIEVEMVFGKQEVHLSNRRSCHGTKLLKSSFIFAPFFLPLSGGTGHGSSQPEHQGHSEIYPSTLNVVSNCPSLGEYMQRSFIKCADVCGSYMQDGNCAYHCMRDSSKTKLVEFCAKPKPLFDFCPEYDPVDQTIQKDLGTLCNSTFSRNYYNSSDIYFCDPNNCLQLRESSVRSGATTLTTLINETTEMNGGDNQEWFLPLTVVLAALILAITIGCILVFSARIRKMTNERNQDGRPYLTNDELM